MGIPITTQQMLAMHTEAGMPAEEIAARAKRTLRFVQKLIRAGTKNTDAERLNIWKLHVEHWTVAAIAAHVAKPAGFVRASIETTQRELATYYADNAHMVRATYTAQLEASAAEAYAAWKESCTAANQAEKPADTQGPDPRYLSIIESSLMSAAKLNGAIKQPPDIALNNHFHPQALTGVSELTADEVDQRILRIAKRISAEPV